jgi:hypothetical protein
VTRSVTKRHRKADGKGQPTGILQITKDKDASEAATFARAILRPSVRAAAITRGFSAPSFGDVDLTCLVDEIGSQVTAVHNGDLRRAEAMLIAQAHSLDAIFQELVRRSGANMGKHLDTAATYMRLALSAQSQCRATLATLAIVKTPTRIAFVHQANISQGPQQVNNVLTSPIPVREKVETIANESARQLVPIAKDT